MEGYEGGGSDEPEDIQRLERQLSEIESRKARASESDRRDQKRKNLRGAIRQHGEKPVA
jgi:hypothetical protein